MSIIKVMDVNLSNKIAAGEVVETLMNVVKELVENSIDASAKEIKINLIESGIKEIKVIDDGIGMDETDAKNAFLRHATSKLYTDDDLFNINTLGFRGEALPSIASVSKMILETSNNISSTRVEVEGGEIIKIVPAIQRKGTSITVKDIFYNTPARLKYLKSLYTEVSNISNYINKMALAHPEIKFILTNDDKELLNTDGSGNLLKVINNVYGLEVAKKMLKIEGANDDYDISGFISYPEVTRSTKNAITILVNGRSLKNQDVIRTIMDAYHTYIFKDRTPIVVLNISVDPAIIDVNVHPTKMDIKFSKLDELKELIFTTISKSLSKLTLIPEAKYEPRPVSNINNVTTINKSIDYKDESITPVKFENIEFDFEIKEEEIPYEAENHNEKYKKINPIGLVHGTYIIGENEDGMYIIDQHAANERINYEYYKKEMGKETKEKIELLVPIKMEFTSNEYLILKQNFDILTKLNIEYEEFGQNTLIIRTHPYWIKKDHTEESLRKIMEIIITNEHFDKEKFNEKVAITLACKMSIKANEHISLEEMNILLERLSKTSNPFTCPHGRPTTIIHTSYELQKMFKRVE